MVGHCRLRLVIGQSVEVDNCPPMSSLPRKLVSACQGQFRLPCQTEMPEL